MYLFEKLVNKIISQNRFIRRLILCTVDLILLSTSYLISNLIVFDNLSGKNDNDSTIFIILILDTLGLIYYIFLGKYKGITKYASSIDLYSLFIKNFLINSTFILILFTLKFDLNNSKFWIIFWILQTAIIGGTNFVFRDILQKLNSGKFGYKARVIIYGASTKGAQLAATIKLDSNYKLVAFFDDSRLLWGRNIGGIKIYDPNDIEKFKGKIVKIFLSDPKKLNPENKFKLFDKSIKYGIDILQLPSFDQIASINNRLSSYKRIKIEDLLSRNSVEADQNLINQTINDSVIFITGGGGSIGSQLCREALNHSPKTLIILEVNEENLYKIQNEFNGLNKNNIKIKYFLGTATNKTLLNNIFKKYNVNILFHAAAYKHVPIVEENPLAGVFNNVISTFVVCEAARIANLKKVILISTDKAVRPTNVMGASKRLSELVVQAFAENSKKLLNKTHYSMVRFGNVLGSSGSVVPLFEKQISNGGPVTITHKDIIRYFMTIKEASQLVIQAASLAKGGEVFILDMGKPVKIYDLAVKMIKLSGSDIRSKDNPEGEIEIISTGLRPGEKLYEELLINGEAESTTHPLIFKAKERYEKSETIFKAVKELYKDLEMGNKVKVLDTLKKYVPEWESNIN